MNSYEAAEKHLKALRSFRKSSAILDTGYDWLSGEIAFIERDLYGHELPNGMKDWYRKMTSGNWSFYKMLFKKITVIVTLFFRKLNRGYPNEIYWYGQIRIRSSRSTGSKSS